MLFSSEKAFKRYYPNFILKPWAQMARLHEEGRHLIFTEECWVCGSQVILPSFQKSLGDSVMKKAHMVVMLD